MTLIETLEDLQGLKRYDKCTYICKDCKKEITQMVQTARRSNLLCITCLRKRRGIEKYGSEELWKEHLKETKAKGDKTLIEKTGDPHIRHTLYKEGCLRKYGVDNTSKLQKHRDFMLNHNPASKPEIRKKISMSLSNRTREEKQLSYEKYKETCLSRYGVTSPAQLTVNQIAAHKTKKYKSYDYMFDSYEEVLFYNYHLAKGSNIIPHPHVTFTYEFDGKIHNYFPDFEIDGKYYEIKGHHFLKDDGTWQNPYDLTHNSDLFFEAKHQCTLKNATIIYDNEMDYMLDYFWQNRGSFPYPNENLSKQTDIELIHHFHKSIYDATRKGKPSPKEAWDNECLFKKCVENRLRYVGRCKPSDILQGFNVSKIAPKVSLFNVNFAEYILKKYSTTNNIFDPFSGFSGRLLASSNLNKTYYGQDINVQHVQESNNIIQFKKLKNVDVVVQDIITDTYKVFNDTTLFTCPPYGGKEHWNKNSDEVEKICDEWIDICLQKYNCKEYIFVIDTTEKYKNYIVETITNKSHFGENNEYILYIQR